MLISLLLPGEPHPVPITNLFDHEGDDVDEWDDAHSFVAGPLASGQWFTGLTADFQVAALH